jgi:hypothetical protein
MKVRKPVLLACVTAGTVGAGVVPMLTMRPGGTRPEEREEGMPADTLASAPTDEALEAPVG